MLRHVLLTACAAAVLLCGAEPAFSRSDRLEDLQQDLDALIEDVEDLREPVGEFELFEECMYLIGVSEEGDRRGRAGYVYGASQRRRPALRLDIRGFGTPDFLFLAFPAEEPPSIECNEDAGQEDSDD